MYNGYSQKIHNNGDIIQGIKDIETLTCDSRQIYDVNYHAIKMLSHTIERLSQKIKFFSNIQDARRDYNLI